MQKQTKCDLCESKEWKSIYFNYYEKIKNKKEVSKEVSLHMTRYEIYYILIGDWIQVFQRQNHEQNLILNTTLYY